MRDTWLVKAPSGTSRTVIIFDGDVWKNLGFCASVWTAHYDANVVLVSSLHRSDRIADLAEPERSAQMLSDVLTQVAQHWS
ncbi:hypothetical protein MMA61_24385, partial [Salmonella enterica]|nr:hypothetical protein [Salmonella enterica]